MKKRRCLFAEASAVNVINIVAVMPYKSEKIAEIQPDKGRAVIRMKADITFNIFKVAVKNKVHIVVFIVDYSERRDCAGL